MGLRKILLSILSYLAEASDFAFRVAFQDRWKTVFVTQFVK